MKYLKYPLIIIILIFLGYALNIYLSPPLSPLDKVTYTSEDIELEVQYSRPYKKGRLIFGLKSDDALVSFTNIGELELIILPIFQLVEKSILEELNFLKGNIGFIQFQITIHGKLF